MNIKIKIFYVFFLPLLLSCSQTTVHLNARYMSEEQVEQVTNALEPHDFEVKVNNHSFPHQINASTLIHSPTMAIRVPETIDEVQRILREVGWDLQELNIFTSSNHRFTGNNLGLFLVPEGVIVGHGRSAQDLANQFHAVECKYAYQLTLKLDGSFEFLGEESDHPSFKGTWKLTSYPYVQLSQEEPHLNFYYQVERDRVLDGVGLVHITTLKPLSKSPRLPDCTLEYGVRN